VNAARAEKNVVVLNGCRNTAGAKNGVRSMCNVKLLQLRDEIRVWLENMDDRTSEQRARRSELIKVRNRITAMIEDEPLGDDYENGKKSTESANSVFP